MFGTESVVMYAEKYTPPLVTLNSGLVSEFPLGRVDEHFAVWTWLDGERAMSIVLSQRFRLWDPDEWQDELSCELRTAAEHR